MFYRQDTPTHLSGQVIMKGVPKSRHLPRVLGDTEVDITQPALSVEIFERQLRRSNASGVSREYISYPFFQHLGQWYEEAVLHLVLRTTDFIGSSPTVQVIFDDSSDGFNWAVLVSYTEAGPADGTYRYVATAPFGSHLRVRLVISGGALPALVLCRGVLSMKRKKVAVVMPSVEGDVQRAASPLLQNIDALWRTNLRPGRGSPILSRRSRPTPPHQNNSPQGRKVSSEKSNAATCGCSESSSSGCPGGGACSCKGSV